MAKNHGAKQQKKLAKQKAKRQEKRTSLMHRDSLDPTIRLRHAAKWPVTRALMAEKLWETGLGYLLIARRDEGGRIVFASFMVDVFCLGVKDAFWHSGSSTKFDEIVEDMQNTQSLVPIEPECLVKILQGAVDYARSLGFGPHRDFKHAALLLQGIDPADCHRQLTYGKDGKPFYVRGPHESSQEVFTILQRVREAGGHYVIDPGMMPILDDDFEDDDDDDDYDDGDSSNDIIIEPVAPPEGE